MAASSDRFQLVSVAEAARVLGISDSTVRRLVKSGRLEAEQAQRPQGHVWLVKVPSPDHQPSEQPSRQLGAAGADPSGPPALTAWLTSVLEPVMAELAVSRQQLISQAETIGRQAAELEALKEPARVVSGSASRMREAEPASAPWLLSLVAIAAVAVLLAAWRW